MREAAARAQCTCNLKQLALALWNYHDTRETFPRAAVTGSDLTLDERLSWLVAILPFMEQQELYDKFDLKAGWNTEDNRGTAERTVKSFICSAQPARTSADAWPNSSYVGIAGIGDEAVFLHLKDRRCGVFGYERQITKDDVTDGTSNTASILETMTDNGRWASGGRATVRAVAPAQQPYLGEHRAFGMDHRRPFLGSIHFSSEGSLGNAAMLDGSVRVFNPSTSSRTLESLATIAGGEEISMSDF